MKSKEEALHDFLDIIQKSWTWKRLSFAEMDNAVKLLKGSKLIGNYKQRFEFLNHVYYAYLLGLGYKPQWREERRVS